MNILRALTWRILLRHVFGGVVIEDGRARGTVKLVDSEGLSGTKYSIDLTIDVEVLKLPASKE